MPRDLNRLAAPAVFCNSVRRSVRRRSPERNRFRQRDRLLDDRECEYDDFAAEIASYNRLRRGDRSASNSASRDSRRSYESLPLYANSTHVITPRSDAHYPASRLDNDVHQHVRCTRVSAENDVHQRVGVPTYYHAPYASENYTRSSSSSQMDRDDSQQKKHKKKRRHPHHHCHSRNKTEKRGESGSTTRPPRDTIAALKALADYGDTNHSVSSLSPVHYYDSYRKFERKESRASKSPTLVCNIGSEIVDKTEKPVTVNERVSSPNANCTRDDLSLGECTDDDDEPVDINTMQKSQRNGDSLPHTDHSQRKSSPSLSVCSSSAISSSLSTKKLHSDSSSRQTEDSSMHFDNVSSDSHIPRAKPWVESKTHREELPTKLDKNSSVHNEDQSVVHKRSAVNKKSPVVNDGSKPAVDEKRTAERKSRLSESTQNSRKKSANGDDQRKAEDDTLPRLVL